MHSYAITQLYFIPGLCALQCGTAFRNRQWEQWEHCKAHHPPPLEQAILRALQCGTAFCNRQWEQVTGPPPTPTGTGRQVDGSQFAASLDCRMTGDVPLSTCGCADAKPVQPSVTCLSLCTKPVPDLFLKSAARIEAALPVALLATHSHRVVKV